VGGRFGSYLVSQIQNPLWDPVKGSPKAVLFQGEASRAVNKRSQAWLPKPVWHVELGPGGSIWTGLAVGQGLFDALWFGALKYLLLVWAVWPRGLLVQLPG